MSSAVCFFCQNFEIPILQNKDFDFKLLVEIFEKILIFFKDVKIIFKLSERKNDDPIISAKNWIYWRW
jgi:hypothetical protein